MRLCALFLLLANTASAGWFFGGAQYVANTAVFDGTNDHARLTSSGPTGLADGKVGFFSAWVNMSGSSDGTQYTLFSVAPNAGGVRLFLRRTTGNKIQIEGRNAADGTILNVSTTTNFTAAAGWIWVFWTWDLTNSSLQRLYVNGAAETPTTTTHTDDTLDIIGTNYQYTLGANGAASPATRFSGAMANVCYDDTYLDSPATFGNTTTSKPKDPGATATNAVFWLSGNGDAFATNGGTGGGLTLTGTLGTTTPP